MAGERLTLPQVLERAVACQNAGNLAEAERLCKLILDARPDHAEAWLTRAAVLCGLKRYEEALAGFARVRKHGTVSPRLLYLEGLALYELERPTEALERFDEVLKGNPGHPESHFFRGNALFRLGRFGEARESFGTALGHRPDFADAALNRGLSAQRLNRHAEAIADLDKALALAPPTADALYGRGLSLENLNRWQEALETYRRALALEPGHAKAQLASVMAQVPIVYRDAAEIAERRAAYAGALQAWCDTVDGMAKASEIGLRPGATIYWSGQSLFKYLPQHDEVFCRIAREVSDCQFVFVGHQQGETVTDQVRARLAQALAAHGLDAGRYCVFLPRLNQQELTAAIGACDVILDTIHWSGFNSILDTLVHNLPIVTTPGPQMRGRHATAILRMMEVTETIGATVDDYVAIAVRLATDEPFRRTVRQKISLHKHRVFRDQACIAGLEDFLIRAVRAR